MGRIFPIFFPSLTGTFATGVKRGPPVQRRACVDQCRAALFVTRHSLFSRLPYGQKKSVVWHVACEASVRVVFQLSQMEGNREDALELRR
jgi:hypothetical protein